MWGSAETVKPVRVDGKLNGAQYKAVVEENPLRLENRDAMIPLFSDTWI